MHWFLNSVPFYQLVDYMGFRVLATPSIPPDQKLVFKYQLDEKGVLHGQAMTDEAKAVCSRIGKHMGLSEPTLLSNMV